MNHLMVLSISPLPTVLVHMNTLQNTTLYKYHKEVNNVFDAFFIISEKNEGKLERKNLIFFFFTILFSILIVSKMNLDIKEFSCIPPLKILLWVYIELEAPVTANTTTWLKYIYVHTYIHTNSDIYWALALSGFSHFYRLIFSLILV